MGNSHSHHRHEPRADSKARDPRPKIGSRSDSKISNNTTSTSSTSSKSSRSSRSSKSSISRSQSPPAPSFSCKYLGHNSRSSDDSHKTMDASPQGPETRPPIRIGYPYYEEVTMFAEKDEKKPKMQCLRWSMRW
ncbi:hypothetical protein NHQ30_002396 [Ciborinia camelliae]|nr:hypothetical protein NHQ30_002396 [Ciborinia camelliae]